MSQKDKESPQGIHLYESKIGGAEKKKPAIVFAIILGAFGVHKFYLGYKQQGILMLLCSAIGTLVFGLIPVLVVVIALIEAMLYARKTDQEFVETYIQKKRPWF